MSKLNVKAFGLTLGIICAVYMLGLGLLAWAFGWGLEFVDVISSIYLGYDATFFGSIIGGIWGFIDGGICGIIIAWLYNKLAK